MAESLQISELVRKNCAILKLVFLPAFLLDLACGPMGDLKIKEIEKDQYLNNSIIEYLSFLLMKGMKLPMLNDKQVELFKFLTGVMYYKHYYKYNDNNIL